MRKERKRSLFPLSRNALEISLTETASVCFLSESRKASESRTLLARVRYSTDRYSSLSLSSCSQYFCNNLQWELSLPGFWLKSNNQDMTYFPRAGLINHRFTDEEIGLGKSHVWNKTLMSVSINPVVSPLYHSGSMAWLETVLYNG